jgi:hypothetical protein
MSDDQNAGPKKPQSAQAFRTVSRAPAPLPRIAASSWSPPKPNVQPDHLENLQHALRRCEELIRAGRTLRRFRGSLWDEEKKRWGIYRPQIDDWLKLSREAGLSDDPEIVQLLPRIDVLDPEWAIACALRRAMAAEQSSTHTASALVPEANPSPLTNEDELREDIEKSIAQCRRFESERVRAKPDWSLWNVLSWIAFRDLALLCEIQNEGELRRVIWYGHPSLKAYAPESLLISALQRGQLRGIREGEELKAHYWYGKWKADCDTRFDRDSVLQIWRDDPWSLAQTMIWIITRDPQHVEDACAYGPDSAWAALVIEQRPQIQIRSAAGELMQHCQQGEIQTFNGRSPIKSDVWKDLQIGFIEGAPFVQRAGLSDAYPNIGFSPADALRQFPPDKKPDDIHAIAAKDEWQTLRCQRRTRIAGWFNCRQECTALEKRVWLCLTEIADEYARKRGALAVDDKERELALEALRRSILTREFFVLNMHPSGLAEFRFDPQGASIPEIFSPIARHLWIRHQDCVAWFERHGLELPNRLRREPSYSPMIAVGETINGGVNVYASGTQFDGDYDKRKMESFTLVEALNPEDEQGGDHEDRGNAKSPGRQRLLERPLGENGRANTVTAAWDTIGLHDEWATNGIPLYWSKETAGKNVNTHFQKLVRHRKLNPDNYDLLRFDSDGQPKISPESVDRALVSRRPNRA